jgi:hypothetical protein
MNRTSIITSLLLGILPAIASANYFCTGPVDNIGVDINGTVWMTSSTVGFSYVPICSVSTTTNGPTTAACQAILATLLRAQATGAQVQWAFNDSLTCSTHPAWQWLTGWYWGPQVTTQ